MAEIVTASILANSEVITATLTSGSEQMTAIINVAARGPMGPVGSGAWGTITGTLSNQTDLQTALNLKANLASPTFTGVVTAPRITGRCDGLEVLCKAGLAINAGQVVYVTGASGTNIVIGLARANAESTSYKTLGISESTLAHNATGYVITEGLMTVSISAPTANEGDPIWLSPTTAGSMVFGLANKPSAPNHIVYLGVVTRKTGNTVAEIYVKVQDGAELNELSDVVITSAVAGQALIRGATLWENRSLVIADITDATTYVPFLAAASNTFTGLASFTNTTRPTSSGTGTPAATSLITQTDGVDLAINPNNIIVRDDFMGGGSASQNIGDLGWFTFSSGGGTGAAIASPSSTLPNIGVKNLTCGNATSAGTVVYLVSLSNLLTYAGWELCFVTKLTQTTDCDLIVGLTKDNAAIGIGKFGGISFGARYSSATDTNFMFYSKNTNLTFAANDANNYAISSGVAAGTTFNTFRIRSIVAGALQMSINGGSFVAVDNSSITTTGVFIPFFYIATRTTTSKSIDVDFFSMEMQNIAR